MNKTAKDFWGFVPWVLLIYAFFFHAPEREETGFHRGLCVAGQGVSDESLEYCQSIHP